MKTKLIACMLIALAVTGCSSNRVHTFDLEYKPGLSRAPHTTVVPSPVVEVALFEDVRSVVESDDPRSQAIIGKDGVSGYSREYGVNYQGVEKTAVNKLVQSLLTQELSGLGYKAVAVSGGSSQGYRLSGKIINFSYFLKSHIFTMSTLYKVDMLVTLTDQNGAIIFQNKMFSEEMKQDEGMAALHNRLLNAAFDPVFKSAATKLAVELSHSIK